MGALLANITSTICNKKNNDKTKSSWRLLLLLKTDLCRIRIGIKKSPRQNKIVPLGIISESLFNQGLSDKVTAIAAITIFRNVPLLLFKFRIMAEPYATPMGKLNKIPT
jgi:hypothetical protein